MKTKLLCFIAVFFGTVSFAFASDKIHVSAIERFSTTEPSNNIDVKIISNAKLGNYEFNEDDILHCNVVKITKPKRGKLNAGFSVVPVSYSRDGQTNTIIEEFNGKYSSKILSKEELKNIDAKKAGKKAAITIGNHFIKGIAPVASLATGVIKNEEGNRLESGVKQVYKDSVFSYAEKGKDIVLEPGDQFYFIFKTNNKTAEENDISDAVEDYEEQENNPL